MIIEGEFLSSAQLRWNLGWPTPNYAGAFLAMLLSLAFIFSRCRFRWLVFLIEVCGVFLLTKTYSRGAVVAYGAAWLFGFCSSRCLAYSMERWVWLARVCVLALLSFVAGFSWSRTGGAIPDTTPITQIDGSVSNRLMLWKGGIRMIGAAPVTGWGAGESGGVYMNWYQDLDRDEGYTTTVNSYLHVAVEHGVLLLMVVLFCLITVMLIAWLVVRKNEGRERVSSALRRSDWALGAGASLAAWAVANVFTTLWIDPRLWVIPGLSCCILLCLAWRGKTGVFKLAVVVAACAAVVATAALYGLGRGLMARGDLIVYPTGVGAITIGPAKKGQPEWYAWPDSSVLGATPGKEFRRWLMEEDAPRIRLTVFSPISGPEETGSARINGVLLFGRQVERVGRSVPARCEALWIIHPTVAPCEIDPSRLPKEVTVVLSEIDEIGNETAWHSWAHRFGGKVLVSPGCGLDIRSAWPNILRGGSLASSSKSVAHP